MKMPPDNVILAVAKHTREAWLLRRICYWYRYASIQRGGETWITKSHGEWSAETGLSVSQVKRAFARLRAEGVVVTQQHLFKNKCQNYVRITHTAKALLGASSS